MVALLEMAPFFAVLCLVVFWRRATTRLIEAVAAERPHPPRRATRKLVSRRPPRSEADRGRVLVALAGARAPPRAAAPHFA